MANSAEQTMQHSDRIVFHSSPISLSRWSYFKLTIIFLGYAVYACYISDSILHFMSKAIRTAFPILLFAYMLRTHKDRKLSADRLVDQFISGATKWFVINLSVVSVLLVSSFGVSVIFAVVVKSYKPGYGMEDFLEALKMTSNVTNSSYVEGAHSNSSTALVASPAFTEDHIHGLVCKITSVLASLSLAFSNLMCAYFLMWRWTEAMFGAIRSSEQLGVRVVFNYACAGIFGLCSSIQLFHSGGLGVVTFVGEIMNVMMLTIVIVYLGFGKVEYAFFRGSRGALIRMVNSFLYLFFNHWVVRLPDGCAIEWGKHLLIPVLIVRASICAMAIRYLWKMYLRTLHKF